MRTFDRRFSGTAQHSLGGSKSHMRTNKIRNLSKGQAHKSTLFLYSARIFKRAVMKDKKARRDGGAWCCTVIPYEASNRNITTIWRWNIHFVFTFCVFWFHVFHDHITSAVCIFIRFFLYAFDISFCSSCFISAFLYSLPFIYFNISHIRGAKYKKKTKRRGW